MRIVRGSFGRRRMAALLAAGLLAAVGAQAAAATATPPVANSHAPAKPAPDDIVDDGTGGDEGEPTQAGPNGGSDAAPLTHADAVRATREGLSRSRIGVGIKELRILDYVLIGTVGVLLLLVILLLVLVAGLRSRLAGLAPAAATPRSIAQEEEQLYGAPPLA